MARDPAGAFRAARLHPRFAAAVVLLLGLGPSIAIFSVLRAVLVRPLPFDRPEQLVYAWETAPRMGLQRSIVSPPNFDDWRRRSTVFQHLAAFRTWSAHLLRGLLFGIAPTDPVTYAAGALVFSITAVLACWLPARRAARVDPVVALRCE